MALPADARASVYFVYDINRSAAQVCELAHTWPRVFTNKGFVRRSMSASLMGRLGSSTFRLFTCAVSMSFAGSRFSSDSAPGPFQPDACRGAIHSADDQNEAIENGIRNGHKYDRHRAGRLG